MATMASMGGKKRTKKLKKNKQNETRDNCDESMIDCLGLQEFREVLEKLEIRLEKKSNRRHEQLIKSLENLERLNKEKYQKSSFWSNVSKILNSIPGWMILSSQGSRCNIIAMQLQQWSRQCQ